MLQEIRIIPVVVIEKAECQETGKKNGENKRDVSQNLRERGRNTTETLRTWKALGGKLSVPAETWHCATIWLKLNSGYGCHPASWYFCFKDLLAAKEILLAIKRPVVFASFLLARFPFHHLLCAKLWQKKKKKKRVPDGEYSQVAVWPLCFPPASLRSPTVTTGLCSTPDARFCL